jgi:hypothetical protein
MLRNGAAQPLFAPHGFGLAMIASLVDQGLVTHEKVRLVEV